MSKEDAINAIVKAIPEYARGLMGTFAVNELRKDIDLILNALMQHTVDSSETPTDRE